MNYDAKMLVLNGGKQQSAYGRHCISLCMQILAPMTKQAETFRMRKKEADILFDYKRSYIMCHMSCVTCHITCVMCPVLHVTCHLSLTPKATATEPPPANSASMHIRPVCKVT